MGEDRNYVVAYHIGTEFLKDGLVVMCPRFFWKRDFSQYLSVKFPDLAQIGRCHELLEDKIITGSEIDGTLFEKFPVKVFKI